MCVETRMRGVSVIIGASKQWSRRERLASNPPPNAGVLHLARLRSLRASIGNAYSQLF